MSGPIPRGSRKAASCVVDVKKKKETEIDSAFRRNDGKLLLGEKEGRLKKGGTAFKKKEGEGGKMQ